MTTFVALGDSVTAGLGDGVTMGRRGVDLTGRGWAAMLAGHLDPPGAFVNLATTGATVGDVRRAQLPAALAAGPTLASVIAGMNDVPRSGFDPVRLVADLTATLVALRRAGAVVLTARLPAPVFPLPGPLRAELVRRTAAVNDAFDEAVAAAGPGVLHLDLAADGETYHPSTWDVDRIHLSRRGHRILARGFADLLASAGMPLRGRPEPGPRPEGPGRAAHAWWLASRGAPWLLLRGASVAPTLWSLARKVPDDPLRPGG